MDRPFSMDEALVRRAAGLSVVLIGVVVLFGPAPEGAHAKKKPTGTLTIQVKGIPKGSSAKVTVQSKRYQERVTKPGRTILKRLRLGRYSIKVKAVSVGGKQALPVKSSVSVVISKKKRKRAVNVVYRQAPPDPQPDPLIASTVSSGEGHTCAIRESGQAVCWGWNDYRQLGEGTTSSNAPVNVQGLSDAIAISAGGVHSCAIRESGQAVCWGSNRFFQLGQEQIVGDNGATHQLIYEVPVSVPGLGDAIDISAGKDHTCAIRQSGQAVCWGWNEYAQLGNRSRVDSASPVGVEGLVDAKEISSGSSHSCAVRQSGQAVCWGRNSFGKLGRGTDTGIRLVPIDVVDLSDAVEIRAGYNHTCAIRESGQALCWGWNRYGQVGDAANENRNVPVDVQALGDAKQISTGVDFTCAIRESGQALCWGWNVQGQLGDGTDTDNNVPGNVQGMVDTREISAGGVHSCAIRESGQAVCWGWNVQGQLGDGTDNPNPFGGVGIDSNVPVNVLSG